MNTKNLFSRFLDNGGTPEEFWAGRALALRQAENRKNKHLKDAEAARREEIMDLMDRGYTRFEAEEKLRLEAFESIDSMGVNPHDRISRRERKARVGLIETA